ncbi:unnamed protein product [Kluyveromyces dobzhanskii CBS 2104]|uniref:WGS project CCBQ000000000 data, contig 00058 n=1 Tax=Kluyveromyces dobzhanskii CBS 2104 TaxID=1427455 RepID=A0A0A8LDU3_9SACH|nr:unnamed protein product [Kluyveromyces dobzhanskii CBS 2104]
MTFKKLSSFEIEYAPQYHFTKYISTRTKLQLVHLNNKSSPLVQGYFAVGTECPTDSGVPHTLEHLVFMGSQKYPYKGLLDTAGNLCMSNTNAWTATDQTVYTLTTAGWTGFKKLLPVYLDHLFYPTLTDDACTTEVYHMDPEDLSDKGVVFSEMAGIESQSWFITALAKQRLLFPEGSGYRSETGGLTPNLRVLTNDEIKEFHKQMYTPDNCCIIVTGNIPSEELVSLMEKFDEQLDPFTKSERKRPFIDTPASHIPNSLTETKEQTVAFPEDDESQGELSFSWITRPYMDHVKDQAVNLLVEYLTESPLAPFNKELIEIENPYATDVESWTDDFIRTISNISLKGVPTERLQETKQKALDLMKNHKVSLDRIRLVTENNKWDYVFKFEKNGDYMLAHMAITDFLYGDVDGRVLKESVQTLNDFDLLLSWSQEQWQTVYEEAFVKNLPVILIGKPSAELNEKIEKDNETRLKERAESLSDVKRHELKEALARAQMNNNATVPADVLESFEIDNPETSVTFTKTQSISCIQVPSNDKDSSLTDKIIKSKPNDFPLFIHFEHFPSQFIELHVALNADFVKNPELLPYYHVITELFSLPMKASDGSIVPFEDVVAQLKTETIDSFIGMGIDGHFSNLIDFKIECKADSYEKAVKWLKSALFDTVFDESRVSILLEKFYNSIVETKREGDQMMYSSMDRNLYTEASLKKSSDKLFVEPIIESVLNDIEDGLYTKKILPKLESLRGQLTEQLHRGHFLVFGDINKLEDVFEPWNLHFVPKINNSSTVKIDVPPTPSLAKNLSAVGKNPTKKTFITSTPASESTYMFALTSLPTDLHYLHPDFPKIYLAAVYLECVEGPFWKGIRGAGLAYGAYVSKMFESNMVGFNIYRASDAIASFEAGKQIVSEYATGKQSFEPILIKAAISSIINTIASSESNYFNVAINKYLNTFCKKRGPDFNTEILRRLEDVTSHDLKAVMSDIYTKMFDPKYGSVFIACHPSKTESIKGYFESLNYDVNVEEIFDEDDSEGDSEDDSEDEH